jgi:hypothetical protein
LVRAIRVSKVSGYRFRKALVLFLISQWCLWAGIESRPNTTGIENRQEAIQIESLHKSTGIGSGHNNVGIKSGHDAVGTEGHDAVGTENRHNPLELKTGVDKIYTSDIVKKNIVKGQISLVRFWLLGDYRRDDSRRTNAEGNGGVEEDSGSGEER